MDNGIRSTDAPAPSESFERVMQACAFVRPDRIPRFDNFWSFPDLWQEALGPIHEFSDVSVWVPNEGTWPTRARHLERRDGWDYAVDSWGRTVRTRLGAYFVDVIDVPVPIGKNPDTIVFDPPDLDERFLIHGDRTEDALRADKADFCVVAKTGGPFLRTSFVRGETQYLMDMVSDESYARALTARVGDHLSRVGLETLKRWDLYEAGIWIYDDMAYNANPMFSPTSFERILLPVYRSMVKRFREAGASHVFLHSDGNIMPLMDMIVDAGIDGINPMERKAGMDPSALRARFPDLVLTGGMCNSVTLLSGTPGKIEAEAKELIDLGRGGGVVIGTHSVNPDEIPLNNYLAYHDVCNSYGRFSH